MLYILYHILGNLRFKLVYIFNGLESELVVKCVDLPFFSFSSSNRRLYLHGIIV